MLILQNSAPMFSAVSTAHLRNTMSPHVQTSYRDAAEQLCGRKPCDNARKRLLLPYSSWAVEAPSQSIAWPSTFTAQKHRRRHQRHERAPTPGRTRRSARAVAAATVSAAAGSQAAVQAHAPPTLRARLAARRWPQASRSRRSSASTCACGGKVFGPLCSAPLCPHSFARRGILTRRSRITRVGEASCLPLISLVYASLHGLHDAEVMTQRFAMRIARRQAHDTD